VNIYNVITQRIIEQLEKGTIPWRCPWKTGIPKNLLTKTPYRGINAIVLGSLSFPNPYFLTFKQARSLGGFVRKGEKGIPIVFWNFIIDEESEDKKKLPFLRYYTVFNASQCEGIEVPAAPLRQFNQIEDCERIVSEMPDAPKISYAANYAAYSPVTDTVKIPARESFDTSQGFYSTLFHELGHSTGHPSRLNRPGITQDLTFGSSSYSKEELIAELSSSFLCAKAGIVADTINSSASYIAGWLRALKNDKRLIISAAALAQKSSGYILRIESKAALE
jgi:antirestriction protein ArdC